MPLSSDIIEELEFLARSPNRVQILTTLNETGHVKKEGLQAGIDGSRTTLTRNLDALEDRGWLRTDNHACTITPAGREIIADFQELVATANVTSRFQEFFKWLSADEFNLDLRTLANAELVVPEAGDPYTVVNQHIAKLENTAHMRALLPVTGLHAHEKAREQIVANDAEGELVVTPDVADTHQSSPKYEELTREMAATGRFAEYMYNGEISYGLALLDQTVQIMVDENGEPRAMLETATTDVYNWAEETYETYKAQATQVI